MVVYKTSSLNAGTYDPAATGLPLTYKPETSREDWKPHPFNQFVDGPVEGDGFGFGRCLRLVFVRARPLATGGFGTPSVRSRVAFAGRYRHRTAGTASS
jgi:hypothetical protein